MIIVTTEQIPGYRIEKVYGLVWGSTVRAKHIGKDILAGLKNLVGGELTAYTELLDEAREEAIERMIEEAQKIGANAILAFRFGTSSIAQGAAEIYAYGTAVFIQPTHEKKTEHYSNP